AGILSGPSGRPGTVRRWLGSAENQRAEALDKVGRQTIVLDEEAHVDRTVQRIEKQVEVSILVQFTTRHRPAKRVVSFPPPGEKKALAEGFEKAFVILSGGEDGRDDPSATAAEDLYQLAHLLAHVGVHRPRVREAQLARGAAGKCVGDEGPFVRPPAINGGFADLGVIGNLLDLEIRKAGFAQNFQGAAKNRLASLLAARAPRRALPVFPVLCSQQPL